MNQENEDQNTDRRPTEVLHRLLSPAIVALGYDLVYLEVINQRQKVLRLFIDLPLTKQTLEPTKARIGVQDCVIVTKGIDPILETLPELQTIFKGAYDLEVSSPGIDRPLRGEGDFKRFEGQDVRIHTYRPLSQEEIENSEYLQRNPKQKNFTGTLKGIQGTKVKLSIDLSKQQHVIQIPITLISKANIEPKFEIK